MKFAVTRLVPILALTLGLVIAPRSADAALVNPGFETGDLTGWTTFGDSIVASNTDPFAGTWHADLSADDTDPNYAGMYQDQAASPGQLWEATIQARLVSSPGGAARIRLKLEFLVGGSPIFVDGQTLTTVSSSYTELFASGVAPAGATAARITPVVELEGETGSMQGYFDNATLTLIPEPATLTLLAPAALLMLRRRR